MESKNQKKLRQVMLSLKDWQDAMRGNVYKNRKKYSRKSKHKKSWKEKQSEK